MTPRTTILSVDDDETQHYLTRRAFSRLGFEGELVTLLDGSEACQWFKANGQPLMMLLDLRMPLMDGYDVIDVLANGELGDPPPVCVVSSSCRPEDLELTSAHDFVVAYLEKPSSADSIWDATVDLPRIRDLLAEPVPGGRAGPGTGAGSR